MLVVTICFSTALLTIHHHISTGLTGPLHLVAFLFFRHSLVDLCAWDLHPITWCSFSHAVAVRAMSLYFLLKCFAEEFMIDSATAWCPGPAKQVQIIICVHGIGLRCFCWHAVWFPPNMQPCITDKLWCELSKQHRCRRLVLCSNATLCFVERSGRPSKHIIPVQSELKHVAC